MALPRIYGDEKCPLEGYEGITLRLLQNPTGAEWSDFWDGDQTTPEGRERYGRAFHAFYGQSAVIEALDFSTPDAALATIERTDVPDELLSWIINLPIARKQQRSEDLTKKLYGSSTTPPT